MPDRQIQTESDELEEEKMTPAEFREVREELGLSTREFAYVLGINERTIRKWEEDGGRGPNPAAARAVLWMLEDGIQPPELLEVRRAQGV